MSGEPRLWKAWEEQIINLHNESLLSAEVLDCLGRGMACVSDLMDSQGTLGEADDGKNVYELIVLYMDGELDSDWSASYVYERYEEITVDEWGW